MVTRGLHDLYLAYKVTFGRNPGVIQWQYALVASVSEALFKSIWRAIASG